MCEREAEAESETETEGGSRGPRMRANEFPSHNHFLHLRLARDPQRKEYEGREERSLSICQVMEEKESVSVRLVGLATRGFVSPYVRSFLVDFGEQLTKKRIYLGNN